MDKYPLYKKKAAFISDNLDVDFLLDHLGIKRYGQKVKSIYSSDTNPSMCKIPNSNKLKCFSTNNVSNVIEYYQNYKEVDFFSAVDDLEIILGLQHSKISNNTGKKKSKKNNITLYNWEKDEQNKIKRKVSDKLAGKNINLDEITNLLIQNKINKIRIKVISEIIKYCISKNVKDNFTEKGYKYLISERRKLKPKTIRQFALFEIKNVKKLFSHLYEKFSNEELITSGVLKENGQHLLFSNCIYYPYLFDSKPITIRANKYIRDIKNANKYYGLKRVPLKLIFNKDVLMSLNIGDELIICEGEFDTMIVAQMGKNAIGFAGVNAIDYDLIKSLELYKKYKIILAFDNDVAGNNAVKQFKEKISQNVQIYKLPKGKDVTEAYNANK